MSDAQSSFHSAVAALTQYFVGDLSLGESLHRVAQLTIDALPQTDHVGITMMVHVGITMMVDDELKTSVFTHPEVPEIDQAQYRTGEGPCVDAYRTGKPYAIESTLEPGRWQDFRDSASEHGVLSTLSLPMIAHAEPIGALNLYAESERAYDDADRATGELFASHAAFLLANAQAYWDARALSENLQQAMASRATIEQAMGIIMASMGCGPDEAMQVLIRQSQSENIKVRELAAQIVRNATRAR